jgi:hypothetical protein
MSAGQRPFGCAGKRPKPAGGMSEFTAGNRPFGSRSAYLLCHSRRGGVGAKSLHQLRTWQLGGAGVKGQEAVAAEVRCTRHEQAIREVGRWVLLK